MSLSHTPARRSVQIAGVLYLITFVTSIPAVGLYHDVLKDTTFVQGAGSDTGPLWGAFLEVILALSCVGTAVTLYPVARRKSEIGALGFVTSRLIEAGMILVGVVSVLSVVTLRNEAASTSALEAKDLVPAARALVAIHDWTFLLGPGVMSAVNALWIATIMYRSRLVPRLIPAMGLLGAPMLLASSTATLFGFFNQLSAWSVVAALPIALWEFTFGVWMIAKGFRFDPLTSSTTMSVTSV